MRREDWQKILVAAIRSGDGTLMIVARRALLARPDPDRPVKVPFSIASFNDESCRLLFRFSQVELATLAPLLQLPVIVRTKERTSCRRMEAICLVLRRLSVSDRWCDLEPIFCRSSSGMSNVFYCVIEHLAQAFKHVLHLDVDRISRNLPRFAMAVKNKGAEIDNVWAFIDGTVRGCSRPTGSINQRSMYNGHKRKHAVKYQTLVTPDGIIVHVFGPVEGRRHDLTILRRSKLIQTLDQHSVFDGYIIYGDPAYGRSKFFGSPFRGQVTKAQEIVNKSMSKVRVSVEWSFGQVVQYWKFVDDRTQMKIGEKPIATLYKIAVLLTNCVTCMRKRNTNSSFFNLDPPDISEYLNAN